MRIYGPGDRHGIGVVPVEDTGGEQNVSILVDYALAGGDERAVDVVRERDDAD